MTTRAARMVLMAKAELSYGQGIVGLTTKKGVLHGLPFPVHGAIRKADPMTTARTMIARSGDPETCVVLAPFRDGVEAEDLGVYTPLPLWAAMVAAYLRERTKDAPPSDR